MPEIGELRRASELVGVVPASYGKRMMIFAPCEACEEPRWIATRGGKPVTRWCYPCGRREGKRRGTYGREKSPQWKGGRQVTKNGYVTIAPPFSHPLAEMMGKRGRVYEHRWVMANYLGRVLETSEEVHHKNGNKQDNRLENLELTSKRDHASRHSREVQILRARVSELEAEIAGLRGAPREQASTT